MRFGIVSRLLLSLLLTAFFCLSQVEAKKKILIYSYTQGFRHDSIPTAAKVIKSLGKNNSPGWTSVHSENPKDFEKAGWLNQFDALVFLSVSGVALSPSGAENMRKYIEAGGGYVGIHESCDALYHHSWYGRLVGAYFNYHPEICHATLQIQDHSHPSVAHLGNTWRVDDEIYNFLSNPSKLGKTYVLTVDENSYPDPVQSKQDRARMQGKQHPIAWYKEGHLLDYNPHKKVGGGVDPTRAERKAKIAGTGGDGRSFYTGLGHSKQIWHDKVFQAHIHGAISWVNDSPSLQSSSPNAEPGRPGTKYLASDPPVSLGVGNNTSPNAISPMHRPVTNGNLTVGLGSSSPTDFLIDGKMLTLAVAATTTFLLV